MITHTRATAIRATAGGVDGIDGGVDGGGWRIVVWGEGEGGGGIAQAGYYDWLVVTDWSSVRSHDVRLDDDDKGEGGGGGGGGGREECWVLHSTKEGARRMLEETEGGALGEVREGIRRTMVEDFERAMPLFLLASSATAAATTAAEASSRPLPMVVHSAGYQWGAAFPAHDDDVPGSAVPRQMDCHLDAKRRVVVCGDYFGAHRGTAEGAYLSGRAAAERLMRQVNS